MSSGDNNFNDTRRKLLTVFGVIDIVMAYYCTKMCPKLPPHNSSYTFHNSSWTSQNGYFQALIAVVKYMWYGMLTLWGWGGDEEYSRGRGGDWDSSFYCGAL